MFLHRTFEVNEKLTRHAKKQENMAHNQEKKRSIEGDPQVTEMRELLDKSFK